MNIKEVVSLFIKYNYLPSKEIVDLIIKNHISKEEIEKVLNLSKKLNLDGSLSVIDFIKYELLKNQEKNVNWNDIEKVRVYLEKNKGEIHFKTIFSFFLNEGDIENYLKNFVKKKLKCFNDHCEIIVEKVEKKEKKEVISSYEKLFNRINVENNVFDEFYVENEESYNNNEEGKDYEKKEEIKEKNENEELKNEINEKKEEKDKKNEEENKEDEIGSFDDKFLEEIKKKVENLVNESHFSQNKVEWVENNLKVIKSFKANPKSVEVIDFLKYFRSKYKKLKEMLLNRAQNLGLEIVSIDSLKQNNEYSVIAMVRELDLRGDFLVGILEDLTGEIKFKVNLKEVKEANELVPDDVAIFVGKKKGKYFYIEKIIYPDIPNNSVKWLQDYGINEDVYAVILSDIHVGSKLFLKDRFTKFIEWLNGKNNKYHGKIGYVIISGDLVDGVGVYPEQIEELEIGSGYEQYKSFAKFLDLIPSEINVVVGPGNHDIVRLAEPQPILPKDIAEPILELNNTYLVSNPSLLLLRDYIKLLSYHGYSYDFYVNELDHLRGKITYNKINELMKMLLRKRHLVPSYKSAPIAPEHEDHLVIEEIPNFMTSGHIHYSDIGEYKGIKLLSSSCWQAMTPFQEKVGHNPDPGKIPMINLKDGKVKILQF